MLNRDTLLRDAADYKKDAKDRFDAALAALLALAWRYKGRVAEPFSFESDPDLYNEALRICRGLSDECLADAKARFLDAVGDMLDEEDAETAWEHATEGILERFDMGGSHLIVLLDLWVAAAFARDFTESYTRISILRYLRNPFASGLFKGAEDALKWGRGYDRDIAAQLAVIGQNAIISGAMYGEWMDAAARGATYYIRRRGSNYDCPDCDSLCGYPIPITEPFVYLHSRCCCYAEYHFEPMPL